MLKGHVTSLHFKILYLSPCWSRPHIPPLRYGPKPISITQDTHCPFPSPPDASLSAHPPWRLGPAPTLGEPSPAALCLGLPSKAQCRLTRSGSGRDDYLPLGSVVILKLAGMEARVLQI